MFGGIFENVRDDESILVGGLVNHLIQEVTIQVEGVSFIWELFYAFIVMVK